MGSTVRWNRRLAGLIALLLALLVQAGTLAAAVRSCDRTGAGNASVRAGQQVQGEAAAERPAAPLPGVPAPAADTGACTSAIAIVPPAAGTSAPSERELDVAPGDRTRWSDPFLHPVLRPPRA